MYTTKQRIYKYLDKTQKSMLCTFLRSFVSTKVKSTEDVSAEKLLSDFTEDQEYYLKINSSRFNFLSEYLYDELFLSETKEYLQACIKYYEYKKSQAPLIEKQKIYEKEKRKFLQEVKMSKEPPTKKQLYYYERLCKKYNITPKDTAEMSRLSMRDELDRIINEHTRDCANTGK